MSCEKEYKEMKIICLKRKTEEVMRKKCLTVLPKSKMGCFTFFKNAFIGPETRVDDPENYFQLHVLLNVSYSRHNICGRRKSLVL